MSINATRRHEIVDLARAHGFVSIEPLAEQFRVTPQTIRRDINELCEQGVLQRFHGGARLPSSTENLAYPERQVLCRNEKRRIAKLVTEHVPNHASLFINIGTTNEAIADALLGHRGLKVVTNNLNVAKILSGNPDFKVMVAGGEVRHHDGGIVGDATIDLIGQFKMDIGIIGISAIDGDGSLLDFDEREVRIARAILDNSRKVYLAADHTKFGRKAMVRLGKIDHIDAFFTDRLPPPSICRRLSDADTALHIAIGLQSEFGG
ncbi:MAG: DeoR/GlpR family transcriptional regulator [Geminicoccaceae bacterium]